VNPVLSPNGQAILLLTAPLIAGQGKSSPDLLSPGEYKRLAQHLRELKHQPSDLLSPDADEILKKCQTIVDASRLQRLLGRGFLLSQVIERWQARAIWVVSRADPDYPRRLKLRLREDSPAVLYGCGDLALLETGGLAVVGSRHVDDDLIEYTMDVGRLAARAGRTIVSGGAKGIDQSAMRGAIEAGGRVCGVLADSLEKTAMNRENRNLLLDGQLVLISPYDPSAGFNVGNAMQRNKLIYALADASLVVSSDFNKGGTWAGATEQLEKLRFVPVFVKSPSGGSEGLEALQRKGALPWPNPQEAEALDLVFEAAASASAPAEQVGLPLDEPKAQTAVPATEVSAELPGSSIAVPEPSPPESCRAKPDAVSEELPDQSEPAVAMSPEVASDIDAPSQITPAECVFAAVRESARRVLTTPTKDADFAEALGVSSAQAKVWLKRLLEEGVIEKQRKPPGYIVKQSTLFE
jgi:DNA processing protein